VESNEPASLEELIERKRTFTATLAKFRELRVQPKADPTTDTAAGAISDAWPQRARVADAVQLNDDELVNLQSTFRRGLSRRSGQIMSGVR
jgi:hypothetical protein